MPTYTLPQFNLLADVWTAEIGSLVGRWPFKRPARARDYQTVAQLYVQQRVTLAIGVMPFFNQAGNVQSGMGARLDLRVPAGTPLRYPIPNNVDGSSNFDVVEVPAGSGRLYYVIFVTGVHVGFPNEYVMGVLVPYVNVDVAEDLNLELHDALVLAFGTPF